MWRQTCFENSTVKLIDFEAFSGVLSVGINSGVWDKVCKHMWKTHTLEFKSNVSFLYLLFTVKPWTKLLAKAVWSVPVPWWSLGLRDFTMCVKHRASHHLKTQHCLCMEKYVCTLFLGIRIGLWSLWCHWCYLGFQPLST